MGAGYAMAARMSPCAPPPGPIHPLNQLIAFCVKPALSFQKFPKLSEPSSSHSKVPETFAIVIVSFKSLLAITFMKVFIKFHHVGIKFSNFFQPRRFRPHVKNSRNLKRKM
jgi:hypothetical protein